MHNSHDAEEGETYTTSAKPGVLDRPSFLPDPPQAKRVFQIWVLIYALVGAQMGWILRPFIGSPNLPFQWFRPRSGNFFQAVWESLHSLLGVG